MNIFIEVSKGVIFATAWHLLALWALLTVLLFVIDETKTKLRYNIIIIFTIAMVLCPLIDFAGHYFVCTNTIAAANSSSSQVEIIDAETGKAWLTLSERTVQKQANATSVVTERILEGVFTMMWLFGFLCIIIQILYCQLRRYALMSGTSPVRRKLKEKFAEIIETLGISRSIYLFENPTAGPASMTGIYQPSVAVDGKVYDYDETKTSFLLTWQLVKIKLCGNLLEFTANIINCLFFYNPGAWLICSKIKKELQNCYLKNTCRITGIKESEIPQYADVKNEATNVSRGVRLLASTAIGKAISSFRSIPTFTSSIIKSPGNTVSIFLLIIIIAAPSFVVIRRSGNRLLMIASKTRNLYYGAVRKSLFTAAQNANIENLRNNLTKHPEMISVIDLDGSTLLHIAAKNSNGVHLVDYLLASGIDIDAVDKYYRKAVHCYPGSSDTIKLLGIYGQKVDIFAAAGHGFNDLLKEMLTENPELINIIDKGGRTILQHVAESDRLDTAALLFEMGAKPDIYWASRLGLEDDLRKLLEKDDRSGSGYTQLPYGGPLDTAVHFANANITEILLHEGFDPEGILKKEFRPLREAVWNGHEEIAEMLIASGARAVLDLQITESQTDQPIICTKNAILLSGFDVPRKAHYSDNRFLLDMPDSGIAAIKSNCKGYVSTRVSWNTQSYVPARYELSLEKGITVGGKVQDYSGKGIENAVVTLSIPTNFYRHNTPSFEILKSVTSQADGKWQCDDMPYNLDGLSVLVEHKDYYDDDFYAIASLPTSESLRGKKAVLVLPERIDFNGTVVDTNGNAVSNAAIVLTCGEKTKETKSSKQGLFQFDGIPATRVHVDAIAERMAREIIRLELSRETANINVIMQPARKVTIKAVDGKSGKPIEDVKFNILYLQDYTSKLEITTNSKGNAAWYDAPVEKVWVGVMAHGYQFTRLLVNEVNSDYTVKLFKPVTVTGTITDKTNGNPITNFSIRREHTSLNLSTNEEDTVVYDSEKNNSIEGAYKLKQYISELSHRLRIEAVGYKPVVSRDFIDEDGDVELNFKLERQPWITGNVIEGENTPAAGAIVILCKPLSFVSLGNGSLLDIEDDNSRAIQTGESGYFTFPDPKNAWTLIAYNDAGYCRVNKAKFMKNNSIQLLDWAGVHGSLLLDGIAMPNQSLVINSKTKNLTGDIWQSYKLRTDDNGIFELPRIAPGKYWIGLLGETDSVFVNEIAEIEIPVGETVKIDIKCQSQT